MARVEIQTAIKKFSVAEDFYGIFFEDINRSGDGCLYPEMIRNRSFEDSIPPERVNMMDGTYAFSTPNGWRDQFNNGEGLKKWMNGVEETSIPGWYHNRAHMELLRYDCLNRNREAALQVFFQKNGYIYNVGYKGIYIENKKYRFYMFAKAKDAVRLRIKLVSEEQEVCSSKELEVCGNSYKKYDVLLDACGQNAKSMLQIEALNEGIVTFGFVSLMPEETYKNHGMNPKVMDMLKNMKCTFLRFPGGCIVEGFTKETATRFSNTIGPVWERPSQNLMWHYRTTNGLGFHEFLQVCEDLGLSALYVANCGITCQGRKPEFFEGIEIEKMLNETLWALEYAMGSEESYWGKMRAEAGHSEPFKIKYLEIGNENIGEEYEARYEYFYTRIKEKYPDIIIISNTHTEERGLQTEIVDEHLYSTADAFVTAGKSYLNYDRKGPRVFVGEYAVTSGTDVGNLRSALAEAMYLIDLEKNQDIVSMTAYAPLIQNINYTSWEPDLLVYNGKDIYGIPFYHVLGMMARHRGKYLVASQIEGREDIPHYKGLYGLVLYKEGTRIQNVRINGEDASVSNQILGELYSDEEGILNCRSDYQDEFKGHPNMGDIPAHTTFVTFGEEEMEDGCFEVDIFVDTPDFKADFCFWCHSCEMVFSRDETRPMASKWNAVYTDRCIWSVEAETGGFSSVNRFNNTPFEDRKKLSLKIGAYNHFKVTTSGGKISCWVNEQKIQEARLDPYPVISEVVTMDEEYIYIKLLNYSVKEEITEIIFDCSVESEYTVEVLTGENEKARNSFAHPMNVSPQIRKAVGAAQKFEYKLPGNSLNILTVKRIKNR